MTSIPKWRHALDGFVGELRSLYGSRLDGVILYGSRARGDGQDDADIDTLVILDPVGDFWVEFGRIGSIANDLSLEHDVVISAIPVDLRDYRDALEPLFLNVRREGLRLV